MELSRQPFNVREMLITDTVIGFVAPAVSMRTGDAHLLTNIVSGQIYSHCIGTLAHLSLFWVYPKIAEWKPAPRWMVVFLMLALDATAGCAAGGLIMILLGYYPIEKFWVQYRNAYRISLIVTFIFGITGAITETLKAKLEWATRQRERATKLATEARLSSLESRIHPHFLFNALNSISSLVREDPEKAERLIERMATLLRFSLDANQLGFITLAQEMDIVRGYLEIEEARFGNRLSIAIGVPPEIGHLYVPPLSIQTLVENSVKHAIAPKREGGAIEVTAHVHGSNLEVNIDDGGPGVELSSAPPGHGIDLLQSRLQAIYGSAGTLRAEGSTITLTIPCSAPTLSTTKS